MIQAVPRNLRELTRDQIVDTLLEIEPLSRDDFLKIRETLTRMGIPNKEGNVLVQSCHLLQKKGRYFIVSYRELFGLDGRTIEMTETDYARRNAIAFSLEDWGLCKIKRVPDEPEVDVEFTVIPHKDKEKWELTPKYQMGLLKKPSTSNS